MNTKHLFFKKSFLAMALLAVAAVACKKSNTGNIIPAAQFIADSKDVVLPTELSTKLTSDEFLFALYAQGTQNYTAITSGSGSPAWSTSTPVADLFDETNAKIGTHYGGPTWKIGTTDSIKGISPTPRVMNTKNIPWLVLQIASPAPTGKFAQVSRIVRMNTQGGIAPANPPSAEDVKEDVKKSRKESIPYTAIYWFYKKK